MKREQTATIFFLPLEDRPKHFSPLKKFKGNFWHTGIIFNDEVYECFNLGLWSISGIAKLKKDEFKNAVYIKTKIKGEKLISELKSGTDCAEYVARCTGLSNSTGSSKGRLWPEDVLNGLRERKKKN